MEVRFNFGASGLLVQQLRQGAPVDLLLTADLASMDQAASLALIRPETRIDFAGNVLVLIEAAKTAAPLRQLSDLSQPGVRRIAIGKPASVPAGRYAREVLEAAGLWDALQPSSCPPTTCARRWTMWRAARCSRVLSTSATQRPRATSCAWCSASTWPCATPARSSKASPRAGLAAAFLLHLRSREAQAVLAQRGFITPP